MCFSLQLAEEKLLTNRYMEQEQYLSSSRSSATQYYNLDESETSGLSSFNQTGLMFMSPDQLQSITDALAHHHPSEVSCSGDYMVTLDYFLDPVCSLLLFFIHDPFLPSSLIFIPPHSLSPSSSPPLS